MCCNMKINTLNGYMHFSFKIDCLYTNSTFYYPKKGFIIGNPLHFKWSLISKILRTPSQNSNNILK